MNFCESCELVMDTGSRCPRCGGKKVRPIQLNDPVFLTEMSFMWSGTLQDILREEGIPFRTRSVLGTYLAYYFGRVADDDEFYVCWGDYDRAKQLVELLETAGKGEFDGEMNEVFDTDAGNSDEEYDPDADDPDKEDTLPEQKRRPFGF